MVTLAAYWQDLLNTHELGEWEFITVTTEATGGDARRVILSNEIVNDDTQFDSTRFASWYAYAFANVIEQRQVQQGGYNKTAGSLTVDREFATALPVSTPIWLTRTLPIVRYRGRAGLREAVNAALRDLADEDDITVTGTANGLIDVSAYPWLDDDHILGLYQPRYSTGPDELVAGRPVLRRVGASLYLKPQIALNVGATATLKVGRPAHTFIKSASTGLWTTTTAGLSADLDEALPSLERVTPLALWHAFESLRSRGPQSQNDYWTSRAKEQAAIAADLKWQGRPIGESDTDIEYVGGGESQYQWP